MRGKAWTTSEERYLAESAGRLGVDAIAAALGRSVQSVRVHAARMRAQGFEVGRLARECDAGYETWMVVCPECRTMRSRLVAQGVCPVCRKKALLAEAERRMHAAWAQMPTELKRKSCERMRAQRNPKLMKDARSLDPPRPPDTRGMDPVDAAAAMDDWAYEMERHELMLVSMDITAVKQRTSKWRRKTRKYKESMKQK